VERAFERTRMSFPAREENLFTSSDPGGALNSANKYSFLPTPF